MGEGEPTRYRRNGVWRDGTAPAGVADLVRALNVGNCPVAGATKDCIMLDDGRTLHVRRGFRAKEKT